MLFNLKRKPAPAPINEEEWQPIATCPAEEMVLVACDTYDCGWCLSMASRDPINKMYDDYDGYMFYEWPSNGTRVKMHTPPSHWKRVAPPKTGE